MFYTLNHYPDDGNSALFAEIIRTDFLHLTFRDLDGHSKSQWENFVGTIKKFITHNNIKMIVMDASGDPCNLDYNHKGYSYSLREVQQQLNKECKTIIVTDDWRYYYKPNIDIKFFSQGFYHQSQRNIHKYYDYSDTIYDTNIEKTRPLMCLNRNKEWHRIYLLYLLHKRPWFSKVDYTFILPLDKEYILSDSNLDKPQFTDEEIAYIEQIELPILLAHEKNKPIPVMFTQGASSIDNKVFRENAINLITETSVLDVVGVCLTEKTAKAIMAYQIPIVISNPGASQWLEDVGIDMFSDYIPWKQWDTIEDPKLRISTIAEFVNDIMQSPQSILEKHKSFYLRLQANKERFHSQEFGDLLIKQLH